MRSVILVFHLRNELLDRNSAVGREVGRALLGVCCDGLIFPGRDPGEGHVVVSGVAIAAVGEGLGLGRTIGGG